MLVEVVAEGSVVVEVVVDSDSKGSVVVEGSVVAEVSEGSVVV